MYSHSLWKYLSHDQYKHIYFLKYLYFSALGVGVMQILDEFFSKLGCIASISSSPRFSSTRSSRLQPPGASLWFRLDSPTSYRVSQISTFGRIAVVESGSYPSVIEYLRIFGRRHIRFCLDLQYSTVIDFAPSCDRYLLLDVVES